MDDRRTILVTGGSRGIGRAIAAHLLQRGYRVHICARHRDQLEECAATLRELGPIDGSVLDLADRQAIASFCRSFRGPLHGLVNNAAICKVERIDQRGEAWEEDCSSWDDVLRVNLDGPHFLTKGLVPRLTDGGRIVNISSQLGKEGRAGYGAYCASKFGLIGLTKCWAKELGVRGITVNAICPGWVRTEQAEGDLARLAAEKGVSASEFYALVCAPLELKRFTDPEEVAALVSFLVSPDASGVTGRAWLMNTIWNQE